MRPAPAPPALPPLIEALRDPACYAHSVERIEVLETHISWVILTGTYAYKIKKPVNLGFLDFSTLEARRHFCEEELRLNRRYAPSLYEAVTAITATAARPVVGGNGPPIEYAVRMRQFAADTLAALALADGRLDVAHIDALAAQVAAFHATAAVAAQGSPFGAAETIMASARENFVQLAPLLPQHADQALLDQLRTWSECEYDKRQTQFAARQADGRVRECHGDLHLGNIVLLDGRLTPFDCIEFNPALRWIDVINEIAFLTMDLLDRGRADLAFRFLNAYLEETGDYAGLGLLRFYLVYRALVRAKVHGLRAAQPGADESERTRLLSACRHYLQLAQRCMQDQHPAIVLMHGLSGSGKSLIAQALAENCSAIRLRSDVERKRLSGLRRNERSDSDTGSGIYTENATVTTYNHLLDLARLIARAGYAAIVDATFLKRWQRDLFRREALALGCPFLIIDAIAPERVLRMRIAGRLARGSDVSEASQEVLTQQIAQNEAFTAQELCDVVAVDTAGNDAPAAGREACMALSQRLRGRASAGQTA